MTYYSEREQDRHYRETARELGCICGDLPAHVHILECPLYRPAEEWLEELSKSHDHDEGRPWM
jgi:hypothetical protein